MREKYRKDRTFIARSAAYSAMVVAGVGLFSRLISPILPAAFSVMDFLSEFFVLFFVLLWAVLAIQIEEWRDRVILLAGVVAAGFGALLDVVDEFGMDWYLRALGENAASVLGFALVYFGLRDWLRLNKERYRAIEDRNAYLALHDPLTGLRNRIALDEHVQTLIDRADRESEDYRFAMLYGDLNRFKMVNDTLGHKSGDELLIQVAERLKNTVRSSDLCFRLGGDEFIIVLAHLQEEDDAYGVGQKLVDVVGERYEIEDEVATVSLSLGIAVFPRDGADLDELQRHADIAMYEAKFVGGGVRLFSSELNAKAKRRASLEQDLSQAIERNELTLRYQPIVDGAGRIEVVETLLLWDHPEHGRIGHRTFAPIAEKGGLQEKLGRWALHTALGEFKESILPRLPDISISLNVSLRELSSPDFVEEVERALSAHGVVPSTLILEVPENVFVLNDEGVLRALSALKAIGVRSAIDDFGTKFGSLRQLNELPVEIVKLDHSLLESRGADDDHFVVAEGMIDFLTRLRKQAVLEGIEEAAHLAPFLSNSSLRFQGHYFGKPVPASAL